MARGSAAAGHPDDTRPAPGGYPPAPDAGYPPPYAPPPQPLQPPPPVAFRPGPYSVMGVPGAPPPSGPGAQTQRAYFRPDIEGLRAVAVMAVLLFHIGLPIASGGFVGVDVFYVISGFLITGLLLREGEAAGKVDLLRFYARRMRRLLPAALLVIVVTLAASAVIVSPLRLTEIAGDAAASALYVANFRFALEATDYLALEAPSPLLHYWSLGVEEQFYLLWPLILLAADPHPAAAPHRPLPRRPRRRLVRRSRSTWTDASPAWAFFSPVDAGPGSWPPAPSSPSACCASPRACRERSTCWRSSSASRSSSSVSSSSVWRRPSPASRRCCRWSAPRWSSSAVSRADPAGQAVAGRPGLALPRAHLVLAVPVALAPAHPRAHRPGERRARSCAPRLAGVAILLAAITTELVEQPFRRSGVLARRSRGSSSWA